MRSALSLALITELVRHTQGLIPDNRDIIRNCEITLTCWYARHTEVETLDKLTREVMKVEHKEQGSSSPSPVVLECGAVQFSKPFVAKTWLAVELADSRRR